MTVQSARYAGRVFLMPPAARSPLRRKKNKEFYARGAFAKYFPEDVWERYTSSDSRRVYHVITEKQQQQRQQQQT